MLGFFLRLSILCALVTACHAEKSHEAGDDHDHGLAQAAGTEDPQFCESLKEVHDHEALEGYTISAQKLFQIKIEWSQSLVAGELTNSAKLRLLDLHGEPLALQLKSFKLFMPAMGHGTIKGDKLIFTQDSLEKNVWQVSQIYFSMGGAPKEWVVDVEAGACTQLDKARVVIDQEVL